MEQQGDPLTSAVERLSALKAEHAPILRQIVADEGMSVETRELLVGHLQEEEIEAVRRVSAALGGRGAKSPAPSSSPRTSVGSLRPSPDGGGPVGGRRVGSLRRS